MTERDFELPDAETLAYQMSEAVADQEGDATQEYLVRFMDELFQLEPGLRQHFTGALLEELCEEIVRREDSKHAHAVVELIANIEQDWTSEQ